jgi:hypothetical protein
MTDNPLDFLDGKQTDETVTEEIQEQPQAEPVAEVEAEAESTGEDAPPPGDTESKVKDVPFVALMDEREKRQAAQREAEDARKRLADLEKQLAQYQQPKEKPDFFENPEAVVQQHVTSVKLQLSKFQAEKDFGPDLVAEAYAYFDQHPQESQALLNHPSPFHAAVEHYKRQQTLSKIGADPDAYINAQVEARIAERLAQAQPSAPKAPPPSMSKAPAAGGERLSPGSAFDDVFGA